MIAKVRIAPVEQWCKRALLELEQFPASATIIGKVVEIIPSSMRVDVEEIPDLPGTRFWLVSKETRDALVAEVGESRGRWVCEHMLEMD